MARTFYTAVGHFRRRNDGHGNIYPVVFVNRQEHLLGPGKRLSGPFSAGACWMLDS